ncbi:MAG TPA: hypothetical protein VEU96_14735 [Bryobacteraceae bacterium]|nr:hypothetical protein [Bryobacteraceae bacterium]
MRPIVILALCLARAATAAPDKNCGSRPEYKQFQFWIGEWDVQVDGQVVAKSSIQSIAGGCIILENWMPYGGGAGKSWNFYNRATGKWEQVWVTSAGGVLKVSGVWKDGAIREEGLAYPPGGKPAMHRHSFTPMPPDRVRQFCEESDDGGKTWHAVFDGLYAPAKRTS